MTEKELINQGNKKYSGKDIDVFFNLDICQHSGNCTRGNKEVFNVKRKPWIVQDNANADEVERVINNCPSGALQYIRKVTGDQ